MLHHPTPSSTRFPRLAVLALVLVVGCAPGRAQRAETPVAAAPVYPSFPRGAEAALDADGAVRRKRALVATHAARTVGRRAPHRGDDGSALVHAAYLVSGLDVTGGRAPSAQALYEYARVRGLLHRQTRPRPGDVVFFHDTYDRNGDGKLNDPLTHVALVERVEDDGTVVIIHRAGGSVLRQRMNLLHPNARTDPKTGRTWNHLLRRARPGAPARTTAELFAGFATLHLGGGGAAPTLASR
ncbi:MAG: CHAP domain-containing protein [Myxococcota bacterium]